MVHGCENKYHLLDLRKNQDARGAATMRLVAGYTMTCLFVEPDPQHKRVLKSWLVTKIQDVPRNHWESE